MEKAAGERSMSLDSRLDESRFETPRERLPPQVVLGAVVNASLAVAERPMGLSVRLYKAPCPHVNSEGICLCPNGTPFPCAGGATIWQAADIFFDSRFGRRLSGEKSRAYPDNVLNQWRTLSHQGDTFYPLEDLVETSLNLGRVIDAS